MHLESEPPWCINTPKLLVYDKNFTALFSPSPILNDCLAHCPHVRPPPPCPLSDTHRCYTPPPPATAHVVPTPPRSSATPILSSDLRLSPVSWHRTSFVSSDKWSNSFVGIEEYVSSEVVRSKGHDFAVD